MPFRIQKRRSNCSGMFEFMDSSQEGPAPFNRVEYCWHLQSKPFPCWKMTPDLHITKASYQNLWSLFIQPTLLKVLLVMILVQSPKGWNCRAYTSLNCYVLISLEIAGLCIPSAINTTDHDHTSNRSFLTLLETFHAFIRSDCCTNKKFILICFSSLCYLPSLSWSSNSTVGNICFVIHPQWGRNWLNANTGKRCNRAFVSHWELWLTLSCAF